MANETPKMLEGIRVVDLTSVVFGPYATQILADMGAEVIKVESPLGDQFRYSAKPAKSRGMSPGFLALNRGKRSIVLDLKIEADADVMRALISKADVFIHNVRDKAIGRLGFGYDAVKGIKADIIYVHCVGFGSNGPHADLQAYDDVIQAATGATTLASRVDGDPRPRYIPSLIGDKVAGLNGAQAVLGALVHRLRTGEGQRVEVPMFEAFAHFMLQEHLGGITFDPPVGPAGYGRQIDPNRQPFPTADGHISIVPYTDDSLTRIFTLLGAPERLEEERFSTPRLRAVNVSDIYAEIAKLTPARTTAAWMELLTRAQIPAMPVRDLADMLEDPHLRQSGFFSRKTHPTEGDHYEMSPPIRYGARPGADRRPAPLVGQDSAAIRAELGSPE
jgi:crotonobetainyl-CoA:carnitine CoA-transferase CaiB-like acyl-CoA transferase